MGVYNPRPAQVGQTQVNAVNGFAPAPAMPQNGFAQQGPMPQPNPMRQTVPQPGVPQGPMPAQQQPNPMLGGAGMQQPGQPSMTDRLMSPMAQIGMGLMAASGPSLTPNSPVRGAMAGLNNAMTYQRQQEADAADAKFKQQQLAIQAAKLGQGTALQRDFEYLKKQGYSNEEAMGMLRKGTSIDLGQGADVPTLRDQLSKNEANEWGEYLTGAKNSRAILNNVDVLEQLVEIAPQGPITGRLAQTFPGFSTAGDAFQSQISQMLPYFRVPGSGAQSDKDMEVLERGLASLVGAPETNRLILGTVRRKAELDMQRAEIIRQYQNRDIETDAEARRMLSDLNNQSVLDPEMRRLLMGVGAFNTDDAAAKSNNADVLKQAQSALDEGRDPDIIREMMIEAGIEVPEGFFDGY
jgi:hypothetical protein